MADLKPKTILLVFIHGFKGDDHTFSTFPTHLSDRLSAELSARAAQKEPPIPSSPTPHFPSTTTPEQPTPPPPTITPLLYPPFETRGDLSHTVARLRAWLLEKVIDAEVARGTPSPTVSPGVGVVLVGHSMGGIVAADAVLGIANEFWDERDVVEEEKEGEVGFDVDGGSGDPRRREGREAQGDGDGEGGQETQGTMFPKVLGVLAYDTPYLGISPGVVRYGAEEQYRQGKTWYNGATGAFGAAKSAGFTGGKKNGTPAEAVTSDRSASPGAWNSWGRTALLASAGIAAASGAAYAGRQYFTSGFTWISDHLAFVGCLAREQDLRKRFAGMVMLAEKGIHQTPSAAQQPAYPSSSDPRNSPDQRGPESQPDQLGGRNQARIQDSHEQRKNGNEKIGFAIFYTLLDPRATKLPDQTAPRTFCRLPRNTPSPSSSRTSKTHPSTSSNRSASAPPSASTSTPFSNPPAPPTTTSNTTPTTSKTSIPPNPQITTPSNAAASETAVDERWNRYWVHATNSKAGNEVSAHVNMFEPGENPEYPELVGAGVDALRRWCGGWCFGV